MVRFNFSYDSNVNLEQRVGFELAARMWGIYLTDEVTINLHIASSDSLGDGTAVGGAIPLLHEQDYGVYKAYAQADASSDADQQAMSSLQEGNTTDFLVDNQLIDGNTDILLTSSQAKALGMGKAIELENGTAWERGLVEDNALDGYILISNSFNWNYDYTRSSDAPAGTLDFLSMALHEIGHQLGFISSLDGTLDVDELYSGKTRVSDFSVLDLFRVSTDSSSIDNPDGAVSDLTIGANSYFSIDGGQTNLGAFSTGQAGDGYQASHWKRLKDAMGIMDPTLAYKERLSLGYLDLQALDVLGWDVDYSAVGDEPDMQALLLAAETAVAGSLGIDTALLTENRGGGKNNDLYTMGFSEWWQILEKHVLAMGFSEWWQVFEQSHEQWQKQQDGHPLEMGFSEWWQSFEVTVLNMGFSEWWQTFEADMLNMGFSEWWQLLEMGFSEWWQKLDPFFSTLEKQEWVDDESKLTRILDQGYAQMGLVRGGKDDDIIGGSKDSDRIRGGQGDDLIDGKAGDDTIWGDAGNDVIYGHDGYDHLMGGDGDDVLSGEAMSDQLYGEAGADILSGGEGNDLLSGGIGRDKLNGGTEKDILQGGDGDDALSGGSDHDLLMGAEGRDTVSGDDGNDVLYGDEVLAEGNADLNQLRRNFLKDLWQQERNLRQENAATATQDSLGNNFSASTTTTSSPSDANGLIRIEAESMTLSNGYAIENQNIRNMGTAGAKAATTFNGEAGYYMVAVRYYDESDGQSTLTVNIDGQTIDSWQFTNNNDQHHSRTVSTQIYLSPGDTIELIGDNEGGEFTRVDYIDLIPTDALLETYVEDGGSNLGENLFTNGDFSSNLSGWNISRGNVQATTTNAYDGTSLSLAQNSVADQWVHVFGGQTYQFSAVAKSTGGSWGGLGVTFYDANWQKVGEQQLNVETSDWEVYQSTFVTSEDARYASIWAGTSEHNGQLLVDNVLFQEQLEVPEVTQTDLSIYQAKPWNDGLVAHWSFDEADSNRTQDSLDKLSARLINMETTDLVQGMVGSALSFDGVDERAVVEDGSSLQLGENNADFSVAFWMKLETDAKGSWRSILHKGETGLDRTFAMWLHPDDNRLHYRISTTEHTNEGGDSQSELALNEWTHVSYVKSGNQLSLYLDGQLDSSVTLRGEVIANDDLLRIGSNSLDASIDELKLYDRALTAADLRSLSLYNADVLEGGQGQDTLYGNAGDDRLYGESQNIFELPATKGSSEVFDGTKAEVYEHQDNMLLDQGTVSFSFSTEDMSSTQFLFSKDATYYGDGGHLSIWLNDDQLQMRIQSVVDDGGYVLTSDTLESGQMYDTAVTFGNRGLEMWINGSLVATGSGYKKGIGTSAGGAGNHEPIVIGASQTHSDAQEANKLRDYFTGTIQNVRLFNQQLDSGTIAQLPTAPPSNAVFEALVSDKSNNDVLVGGSGHDTLYGNIGDDILYGDDATVLTDGVQYNGSLYFLTNETTWHDAQAQAELWGGNLVTINDADEEAWLQQTFGTSERFWLGITDETVDGQFEWVSGEAVTYTNWWANRQGSEGDQDYGYLNQGSGDQWGTLPTWFDSQGIIEIELPEESGNDVMVGGIGSDVLYGELGDDVLDGSNAQAKGAYERDVLAGGHGADQFILGDAEGAYYSSDGESDYALIKDFNANEDTVQLHGSLGSYSQQRRGSDSYLYVGSGNSPELVAVLENTTNVNFNRGFKFV